MISKRTENEIFKKIAKFIRNKQIAINSVILGKECLREMFECLFLENRKCESSVLTDQVNIYVLFIDGSGCPGYARCRAMSGYHIKFVLPFVL